MLSTEKVVMPSVAVSCVHNEMVRRGSAVRVRQRALQKPWKQGFCFSMTLEGSSRNWASRHRV
jgi:hypothetical protein